MTTIEIEPARKIQTDKTQRRYTILTGRRTDLAAFAEQTRLGKAPQHALLTLQSLLDANIVHPEETRGTFMQRMASKLAANPSLWDIAGKLAKKLTRDDVVWCIGEANAFPLATLCDRGKNGPVIISAVHNLDRPRGRASVKWLRAAKRVDHWVTNSDHQVWNLKRLGVPETNITYIADPVDTAFFSPGPATPNIRRPIIASIGLEGRDYRTLASAAGDMNVDIRISGFSLDANALKNAFPDVLPANMTRKFYPWDELVQLYRDAMLVVVPLFERNYAAGINGFLEAASVGKPVVCTRTTGMKEYLDRAGVRLQVGIGDVEGMRAAIRWILDHPAEAQAEAQKIHEHIISQNPKDRWANEMAALTKQVQRSI